MGLIDSGGSDTLIGVGSLPHGIEMVEGPVFVVKTKTSETYSSNEAVCLHAIFGRQSLLTVGTLGIESPKP